MSDLQKTIHYTTKAQEICSNLVKYIPNEAKLVEPFSGNGDLLRLFPDNEWEAYDIEEHNNTILRDTLLNPPNYKGKWVITNPPYLAKNKAKDKKIFEKYKVDDLYKATLLSVLDCEGGIFIIPTNFLTDERTNNIRKTFLDRFSILEMNIFTKPIFETTTYSICSFAFKRNEEPQDSQSFFINIFPDNKKINITILSEYSYRIGGDFYNEIENTKNIFSRLIEGQETKDFITNIKLFALDTRKERIRLEYCEELFYGKQTDRSYATLTCKKPLSKEEQLLLIDKFNKYLEDFREKYYDLSLTNYRDYNRKRIGFSFAYKLLSKIYMEVIHYDKR